MRFVNLFDVDVNKQNPFRVNDVDFIKRVLGESYSSCVSNWVVIDNRMICCTWYRAIDMRIIADDEFPVVLGSCLYPPLALYGMRSLDRRIIRKGKMNYHSRGEQSVFIDRNAQEYAISLFSKFNDYSLLMLPDKYLEFIKNPNNDLRISVSIDDYESRKWSNIIESVYHSDAVILDQNDCRLLFVAFDNQLYEILISNSISIKRYCSNVYSIIVYETSNSYSDFLRAIDYLFNYSSLLVPEEWLSKYSCSYKIR